MDHFPKIFVVYAVVYADDVGNVVVVVDVVAGEGFCCHVCLFVSTCPWRVWSDFVVVDAVVVVVVAVVVVVVVVVVVERGNGMKLQGSLD